MRPFGAVGANAHVHVEVWCGGRITCACQLATSLMFLSDAIRLMWCTRMAPTRDKTPRVHAAFFLYRGRSDVETEAKSPEWPPRGQQLLDVRVSHVPQCLWIFSRTLGLYRGFGISCVHLFRVTI